MSKSQKELLHKNLMSWATDEMMYQVTSHSSSHDFQFPSEQDFKILFQKPLDNVWKYVLKHVKSVQTVKHIKGNITVKRSLDAHKGLNTLSETNKEKDMEGDSTLKSRSDIIKELASCISDISYLQNEMEQITKDVMETESSYQRIAQNVRDLQRKESLLEVVALSSNGKIAQYSNCTKKVLDHISEIKKNSDSSSENFVMGGKSHKDGILETKRDRDVRLTCEHISQFLQDVFSGSLSSDIEALKKAESAVWKTVETVAESYNTKSILSSLISIIGYTTKSIKEETHKLDIAKDAQELSFTFEDKCGLHDISQPMPVEKTVKQLLNASNLRHVLRWFKEQEYKNDEWKLTARLEDIMMEIHKHVNRLMEENPRKIHVAQGYIDALIQLAVERSVLPCVREETTRIIEAIEIAKEEKEELHLKLEKIQDFKKVVVLSFVSSKCLENQVSETKTLTSSLRGNLLSELEKFSSIILPCLLVVSLDSHTRLCVLDLSIAPSIFHVLQEKPWIYYDVCAALGIPAFKSTDYLPLRLLELHYSFTDLEIFQQHRGLRIKSAMKNAYTTDDIKHYIELCNKMQQFDKSQCEKYIPKLKKRLENLISSIGKINTIKSQIHSWWEQPAKFTTPWITQEGKTFEQWMQKWRILVTEVHKKMDSKNMTT
ncbi:hypothetical protein Btru_043787 [Bulinus truncatus]|nr:hypothetical protein Btru_043787 [Bulinus truncatus]